MAACLLVAMLCGPVHGLVVRHHHHAHGSGKAISVAHDHCTLCLCQTAGVVPVLQWSEPEPEVALPRWPVRQISSPETITEPSVYLRGPPSLFDEK
ncbi:hypothetical protein [Sabulibacter ruber]|uniref:hypothetical protein n=1 Tax=Sabulibacter ruber TaxID=2811901 RepID=UPI001A96D10B|nr:hypothetical protein [Sabulibacter ruber]